MTTVLTYGTFDLFHIGHLNLLRRLSQLGDKLVVGCSTDAFNEKKGKRTVVPFAHRREILESIRFVHKVIPEESWEQKRVDILREEVSLFAMGDDWAGKFDELKDICQVIYLPRTRDVSTTEIKQLVAAMHGENVLELKRIVERLKAITDSF
nr:adenylyltransferase/cytidyltransferase family protein [Methylobacterium frigidaeris]